MLGDWLPREEGVAGHQPAPIGTDALPTRQSLERKLLMALLAVAGLSQAFALGLLWAAGDGPGLAGWGERWGLLAVACLSLATIAGVTAKILGGLLWRPLAGIVQASLAVQETLAAAERSRRDWVADTSHELRTPLAVLQAEIEALQDGVHEVNEKTLGVLHNEVRHLSKLVGDLNELAQADSGGLSYRFARVDLGAIVLSVTDAFRERLTSLGLELEIAIAGDCLLDADADRLRQLWMNLLENSLRYTNAPGLIRLELKQEDTAISCSIADSAPGVPEGMHQRLFERFFRADPSRTRGRGGSGLGLALAQKIVEAHGGAIVARPSSLGGLEVLMRFPLVRA